MYRYLFILIFFLFSCNSKKCDQLTFNKKTKTTYLNNKPYTGECKSYFISGNIKSKQSYYNGLDNGEWVFYYLNGNIQTKGYFNRGVRIGDWIYYFENGKIWKKNNYDDNGNKTGNWKTFSQNGELIEDLKY